MQQEIKGNILGLLNVHKDLEIIAKNTKKVFH